MRQSNIAGKPSHHIATSCFRLRRTTTRRAKSYQQELADIDNRASIPRSIPSIAADTANIAFISLALLSRWLIALPHSRIRPSSSSSSSSWETRIRLRISCSQRRHRMRSQRRGKGRGRIRLRHRQQTTRTNQPRLHQCFLLRQSPPLPSVTCCKPRSVARHWPRARMPQHTTRR